MDRTSPPEPSVTRELLFGALGGGIALGCLLPPLAHFVTGPLGPFIGGFIAANQVDPQTRGRGIIAATIGVTLAGLSALVALAIANFSEGEYPPSWFPDMDTLGLIVLGIWAYGTALGAAGVAARGVMDAKAAAAPKGP
jgi:hypothetical protein